jgi:Rrf2 family protein
MRNRSADDDQLSFLSTTARHALRAVLILAQRQDEDWIPAQEIAAALDAPPNYLSKVLRILARRGLLESVRGPRGGFRLSVPAGEISVADVLEHVDDAPRSTICLLGVRPCDLNNPCTAHDRWVELRAAVLGPLRRTTIADLVEESPPS